MRHPALLLAAGLGLACQPPPSKSDTETTPTAEPAAAERPTPPNDDAPDADGCAREPLQAELHGYCEYDLGVPPIALPKVAWTAPSYHPLATRVIVVDAGGLTDPEGQGTVSIDAWLSDPPRRLPEPGAMVFAIAGEVPAADVARLWRGLANAGRAEIRVLVHVPDPRPIPQPREPAMLADMREALPPAHNERVMFVAQGVRGYAEVCPPLAGAFGELANVSPGDRCHKLGELAAAAMVECGCPQLPQIMTMLYALTIGFSPPAGRAAAVPIRLDPEAAPINVGEASWSDLATKALTGPELRPLWLVD